MVICNLCKNMTVKEMVWPTFFQLWRIWMMMEDHPYRSPRCSLTLDCSGVKRFASAVAASAQCSELGTFHLEVIRAEWETSGLFFQSPTYSLYRKIMYHRCWTGLDQSSYIHATDNLKRFCTMVGLLYFRTTLESEVQFRDLGSFFARCWWPRESMLWGSSALSEFCTSLSKVITLWHCVKVKQRYHNY